MSHIEVISEMNRVIQKIKTNLQKIHNKSLKHIKTYNNTQKWTRF